MTTHHRALGVPIPAGAEMFARRARQGRCAVVLGANYAPALADSRIPPALLDFRQ
ncbi:hypothetical protein [Nocardia sp. NPDC058480]|uniref:hypothetical protein n=1 Tax=Nocardia sp. NPDC058480 TaxID=3346522 RepID=UPI00365215E0